MQIVWKTTTSQLTLQKTLDRKVWWATDRMWGREKARFQSKWGRVEQLTERLSQLEVSQRAQVES